MAFATALFLFTTTGAGNTADQTGAATRWVVHGNT